MLEGRLHGVHPGILHKGDGVLISIHSSRDTNLELLHRNNIKTQQRRQFEDAGHLNVVLKTNKM